jgi:transposase-like protein
VSVVVSRRRIHYPPPSLRCPHCRSGARHLFYHSAYRTRDGPRLLWQCRKCRRRLSERRGTAFFNLKTPEREVASCLDSLTRGDSQISVAQSRRHKRDTLRRWRGRAAHSARAVDAELITDLRVRDLELDEQWSFAGRKNAAFADSGERGEAWWHKAMAREPASGRAVRQPAHRRSRRNAGQPELRPLGGWLPAQSQQ